MELMNKLRDYQYFNAYSVVDMGYLLSIAPTHVSSILTGKRKPGKPLIYRINKLLESPKGPTKEQIQKEKQKTTPSAKVKKTDAPKVGVVVKPKQKNLPKSPHNHTAKTKIKQD